jgi:murein DD-endopeptidase MepM/ murein hydrolase activator NlpD
MDLSRYVTAGTVSRKINQVSSAEITLRNPNMTFTATRGTPHQVFTPMDPVTIWLMRVKGRPIRVFTGFLDTVPFYEMYPGTITLSASCTLKKLLYTFFDPALPYARDFMHFYGWEPSPTGGMYNPDAIVAAKLPDDEKDPRTKLTDGSIGNLLYATMKHIGGWASDNIFIERLPSDLVDRMVTLYKKIDAGNKLAKEEWTTMMHDIIGSGELGLGDLSGSGGGGVSGSVPDQGNYDGPLDRIFPAHDINHLAGHDRLSRGQIIGLCEKAGFTHDQATEMANIAKGESKYYPGIVQIDPGDGNIGYGLFQITPHAWPKNSPLWAYFHKLGGKNGMRNPWHSALMARRLFHYAQFHPWDGSRYRTQKAADENPAPESYNGTVVTVHAKKSGAGGSDPNPDDSSGGSSTGAAETVADQVHTPIKHVITDSNGYNPPVHKGVDLICDANAVLYAVCDAVVIDARDSGWWTKGASGDISRGDGVIRLRTTNEIGPMKRGTVIGYGHAEHVQVKPGDHVKAGTPIGRAGFANAWHTHFFAGPPGSDARDGEMDVTPLWHMFRDGKAPTGGGISGGGSAGGGGTASLQEMYSVAKATAFATQLEWPTAEETLEAVGLQGQKSMMNDKPLMPFVQQLTDASLRQFQSMPNGNFFAFYPDYFGEFKHRKPYWMIDDIEILDGRIQLTDDSLATHVYVVGDTMPSGSDYLNKLFSAGTMTIENIFGTDGILSREESPAGERPDDNEGVPLELAGKGAAVDFLQRYGARPSLHEEAFIRSPYFEAFMAYQQFMLLWSRQFLTTFTFTFMPELYPGGQVGFPDHGLQMYIDEVEHSWDYTEGFTTTANLSAPSVMGKAETLPPNMIQALNR